MRGRVVRAAAVLAVFGAVLAGTLTACAGLPTSGPVRQGLDMGPQIVPPLRLRFEPPRAGASPAEIVRGFLTAGSDLDDDAAAPRAFLTGRALREWQPRSRVVVHAGTRPRISPRPAPPRCG